MVVKLLNIHLCFLLLVLLSCKGMDKSKDLNIKNKGVVDFKLMKIQQNEDKNFTAYYLFVNKSLDAIPVPLVHMTGDSIGISGEIGFSVLLKGSWVNPGYYVDAIPFRTKLEPGQSLTLKALLPVHLWDEITPFRMHFGEYVSCSAQLIRYTQYDGKQK